MKLDRESLLADVGGDETLDAIESALAAQGLTLGFAATGESVGAWLAKGAPGAPSALHDPADHLLAGLEAILVDGKRLRVHPAPRRAVGPDLVALVVGAHERFAKVERAWLRVHERSARRVSEPLPAGVDLDPPLNDGETRLADAIARELARTP